MNKIVKTILVLILIYLAQSHLIAQRFKAYYTKIDDNYDVLEMVEDKLFGKYADLIVEVYDKGKIRFTRETSYLPAWKTEAGYFLFDEIIERDGDGKGKRPDIISKYSHVRLIKNTTDEIIVHWRYFPDFGNVEWDGVVDEYFKIFPDGKVVRTIRRGTKKYNDWTDSSNIIYKTYQLTTAGIKLISEDKPQFIRHNKFVPINSPVINTTKQNSILKFSFDEGLEGYFGTTKESVSGKQLSIEGPQAYWKKGISGSALEFDGYYSSVDLEDPFKGKALDNFTINSWIALAAYPFGWAPIIQQSEWGKDGFYFGINEEGYPGIHITIEGEWFSLVDSNRIGLFKWNNLSAVYSGDEHTLSLFINGKLAAFRKLSAGVLTPGKSILTVGLNRQKMPPINDRIRIGKWPSMFGIDGLIDEVSFLNKALSSDGVKDMYDELSPGIKTPNMMKRKFPRIPPDINIDEFGANYTTLKYLETWDHLWRVSDHADVVVTFDELPVSIVSWRGISYGHYFVTENGKWIGDQSNEDYRLIDQPGDAEGCLEHMSDKQCRHSHIRIIENTDARVVIHWRYGLVDSRYKFAPGVDGWGGWTDEYWTIYPDGIAVRNVARGIVFGDGWVETMFLSQPGTKPEDNVNLQAFSVINLNGEIENLSWEYGSPETKLNEPVITMVNSKSEYKMFNIFPTGSSIEIFGGHSDRSHFHWWNHWPVSQITSDGRGAKAPDRISHSSLCWGSPSKNFLMYGITNKSLNDLLPLAKSWNNAAPISEIDGCSDSKYLQEERAYHLNAKANIVSFLLMANDESPLVNPAFVIHNWPGDNVELKIDGKVISEGKDFRNGLVDTPEGQNLVVWLDFKSNARTQFEFSLKK